ncbi:MAG: bifunctional biotin--[acetyl-CoA-carboxylase] ligase/biotin operon repressor BirA [Ramlibacter sp.]
MTNPPPGSPDQPMIRPWPLESVWLDSVASLPGLTVELLPEVDSTNSELMRRARIGRHETVLLVADRQTAGRGRLGRVWQSEPGASLTFSLGLPFQPRTWLGLSLAVGVTIAEQLDPRVELKWPNDLWVGDAKLGGILIETAPMGGDPTLRHVIIGIGLNVRAPTAAGLSTSPAWVQQLRPELDAGAVLSAVMPSLAAALRCFRDDGFEPFRDRYRRRDTLAGREVRLSDGMAGRACGVDGQGALLVHTAAGTVAVTSSEVSIRPA